MRLVVCVSGVLLAGSASAQSLVEARDAGVYTLSGGQKAAGPTLLQRTTHICAKLHTSFGVRFVLSAGFGADTLPVDVAILHPATVHDADDTQGPDHMSSALEAGQPHYYGWTFADPARLLPGRWHVILTHGGVVLLDQAFDIDFTCGVPVS